MFKSRIINSIVEISKDEWNSICCENNIQYRYDYLLSLENSLTDQFEFGYYLLYDQKTLVAATPFYFHDQFNLDIVLNNKIKKIVNLIRKLKSNFFTSKVLFCGLPISEYNVISVNESYKTNVKEILNKLVNDLRKIMKVNKKKILIFKDVKEEVCKPYSSVLDDYKFSNFFSLPGTILNTQYNSFEDYSKSLKKKYRNNINNKLNKFKKNEELRVEVVKDYLPYLDEVYNLYLQTYQKAETKFEKLNKEFFLQMYLNNKEDSSMILMWFKDVLCGYTLLLDTPDECINVRIGLDYKYNSKYNTYFIMLYENIRYSIENNKNLLYLSQTSYRPKLELGADIAPLKVYLKAEGIFRHSIYSYFMRKCFKKYEELCLSYKK